MLVGSLKILIVAFLVGMDHVHCTIPSYIQVCPHDHENMTACIIESIEHLRPLLVTGIPEIRVPGLEPLRLDPLQIESLGGGTRLATNISNIEIRGASTFEILSLTPTITKKGHTFRFSVNIEKIYVLAQYEIDSTILFLNLKGSGPFHANITNYYFDCTMKGTKVVRENINHLLFEDMKLDVTIGDVSVYLENVFDGSPTLSTAINEVINDNVHMLFEEIKPNIVKELSKVFTSISNDITLTFPYEELFP